MELGRGLAEVEPGRLVGEGQLPRYARVGAYAPAEVSSEPAHGEEDNPHVELPYKPLPSGQRVSDACFVRFRLPRGTSAGEREVGSSS